MQRDWISGPPDRDRMTVSTDSERLKRAAAEAALTLVRSDMVLGLGTGSTIRHLLELLGEAIRSGRLARIVGVPTSEQTRSRARDAGIELVEFGAGVAPDLTIDGADEVSPSLDLIKGMGGALLREKMVAQASDRLVIIVDERKIVERLGTISPLPVEVAAWGMHAHVGFLETLGALVSIREDATGRVVLSDNGNAFFDCRFPEGIDDPAALEGRLARRSGIVDTGLFLGMADEVLIASDAGVRTMTRGG
jgi:ribose 5-phosphate isomerase A